MTSIEFLLNPLPDFGRLPSPSPSSACSVGTSDSLSMSPHTKKQKMVKDAPVFREGRIRGDLRYPPCEERDEELAAMHEKFQVRPMGNIQQYPRHIPYNSDKKSFQEKTGRESFEVFQYTFKIPGNDRIWTVMWDYNVGLVRTTPLFKCNDYSKTTPSKMLNLNPGLREICHSITGGALAAQGYWMPFDAAKAVAATFCWKIRFALTPLFGLDFPSQCVHPDDRAYFGRMVIDQSIIRKATEMTRMYRMRELRSGPKFLPVFQSATSYPSPSPPATDIKLDTSMRTGEQILLPKTPTSAAQQTYLGILNSSSSSSNNNSGHGGSPEFSESNCTSPTASTRNSFTPVNTPRISDWSCFDSSSGLSSGIPSPQDVLSRASLMYRKAHNDRVSGSDEDNGFSTDSSLYSDLTNTNTDSSTSTSTEAHSDTDSSRDHSLTVNLNNNNTNNRNKRSHDNDKTPPRNDDSPSPPQRRKIERSRPDHLHQKRSHREREPRSVLFAREVKAAHALLSLHMQRATAASREGDGYAYHRSSLFAEGRGQKRRRASA